MKRQAGALIISVIFTVPTAALAARPDRAGAKFVVQAIKGDNSEIALGQLAAERGATQGVRNFGHVLMHDHTLAKSQMNGLAHTLDIKVPSGLSPSGKAQFAQLQKLHGGHFDRVFIRDMIQSHAKTIAKFRKESRAKAGRVSRLASEQLPVLEKHLQIARSLKQDASSGHRMRRR